MPHILIVEDEAAIADTLVYALQADGHSTEWVTLGSAALDQQRQRPADLIILDIGLPDISGFETCRQLRRFTEVPVMFLSARDGEIDRVVGLEIGADDYVVKPFSRGRWLLGYGPSSSVWCLAANRGCSSSTPCAC